ncbi:MAG TPA: DUF2892 domain-containing protein [Gemmatimonadales bacterium]|jgi:hypothetical protein
MFKNNVGGVDTAIRAVLGSLFIVLGAVVADQRPFLALGAGLVGLAVLVTAIAGTCFLYTDLGIDTRPRTRPRSEVKSQLAHQLR